MTVTKYAIANCGYSIGTATEHGWIFYLDSAGVFVSDLEDAVFFDSIEEAEKKINDFGDVEVSVIKVNWHEAS
ncbi:MAG: hypothetical protein MUE44_34775 [Oscillatoriaceae cyanobacterium Prado104]|nr:hypothetical protein [Oscillatoriaceae cyanobacterium Prado104]